jgi:hypothetical protein
VPSGLPSVFFEHSVKTSLPSAKQKTLGKKKHSAKNSLPSVDSLLSVDTRQRILCRVSDFRALSKEFFAECFFLHSANNILKAHFEAVN